MTAVTKARPRRRVITSGHRSGSLVGPFVRHLLVLALTAAVVYLLAGGVTVEEQFTTWLGVAVAIGVLAALLGRRALGVLFVSVGAAVGMMLHLLVRLGSGEAALAELTARGPAYGIAVAVAMVAYLGTWLLFRYVSRSRETG